MLDLVENPEDWFSHNEAHIFHGSNISRLILMEMEKHDDGWPFLQPVNCKQFTSYRKFIKVPMDFSTMKQKLRDER